jgi:hypothetical protein
MWNVFAIAPRVESLTSALEGSLPPTVIHEEFHETNVFVLGGKPRLLDWAEAAVSHPFAGLVNPLRDITYRRRLKPGGREMLRLRSVYLEPWTRFSPSRERSRRCSTRATSSARCAAPSPGIASLPPKAHRARREAVENGVKLGA